MLTAWWIWKHRKAATFDNTEPDNADLLDTIIKAGAQFSVQEGAVDRQALLPAAPRT